MKSLALALAKFQDKCPAIKKNATNPFFKSKYADLPSILETVNPVLHSVGLTAIQYVDGANLITILTEVESGEQILSSYPMLYTGAVTPQVQGSALSYARRYALTTLLGVSAEDDNDGNSVAQSGQKESHDAPQGTQKESPKASASPKETPKASASPKETPKEAPKGDTGISFTGLITKVTGKNYNGKDLTEYLMATDDGSIKVTVWHTPTVEVSDTVNFTGVTEKVSEKYGTQYSAKKVEKVEVPF